MSRSILRKSLSSSSVSTKIFASKRSLIFGIARIATSSTITYTSSVLGTVHYISPEQAKGKFIDEKSDFLTFVALYLS